MIAFHSGHFFLRPLDMLSIDNDVVGSELDRQKMFVEVFPTKKLAT